MPKIKLKEWADRNNLSYITANRHFHAGLIPNATQLDSGTILVEDDSQEQNMAASAATNDAMSLFLKKTVEFSKNNSTVEDFAAYVISNFQLKLNGTLDGPKYSKNRPKSEEIQKHFQQFLPDKEKAEQLKAVKLALKEQVKGRETLSHDPIELSARFTEEPNPFTRVVDTVNTDWMDEEFADIGAVLSSMAPQTPDVHMYGPKTTAEGLVTRSVDLNTTPQQVNYTGSTSQTFSSSTSSLLASTSGDLDGTFATPTVATFFADGAPLGAPPMGVYLNSQPMAAATPFLPTQKELLSSAQVIETAESEDMPRKRGRKPTLIKKR